MKKLSLILAVLMLAALAVVPANAAGCEMLIGTPEIDGVLDDIYEQTGSYTVTTANQVHKSGADYPDCPEFEATSYFLYDDEYVYVCTVVTDATIMETTVGNPAEKYVWQNDVVEHWISLDAGATWGQFNYDAHDTAIGIGLAGVVTADDCQGAATIIDDETYCVEVAFPHGGKTDKVAVSMQINNIMAKDGSKIICIGKQKGPEFAITASDEEVVIEEIVEEAPAAADATAPATFDLVTLAAAALVLSGAGVVVSKKNRK